MGLLTDFFVAPKKRAAKLDPAALPDDLALVQWKNVDPVKLAELAKALGVRGAKDPVAWLDKGLPQVAGDDEGPWLHEVAKPFVRALAAADAAGRRKAATAWSKTGGCKRDGFTARDCQDVVRTLSDLARQAEERGESMFVWMCL